MSHRYFRNLIVILAFTICTGNSAQAISINFDPGDVGSTTPSIMGSFTLLGDATEIDIVFSDMKYVELTTDSPTSSAVPFLGVFPASASGFSYTAYLSNELGDEIIGTSFHGGIDDIGQIWVSYFDVPTTGIIFHDIHYMADTGLFSAGLYYFHINPFGDAQTVVGQRSTIPEPATMLLLGVGLVGLAGVTRRRLK